MIHKGLIEVQVHPQNLVKYLVLLLWSLCLVPGPSPALAQSKIDQLTIVIPGAEGGGYDRTGMAVRRFLLEEELVKSVEMVYSPGAGGLVGLAQFREPTVQTGPAIMIGGRSMLGAIAHNRSNIRLTDLAPIAKLNDIVLVVAVGANSPLSSVDDLKRGLRQNPSAMSFIGGSEGSVDVQFVLELFDALGIGRQQLSYTGVPGGGENIQKLLVSGNYVVAISSYEELAPQLKTGKLRPLVVTSAARLPGVTAPTLRESGIDLVFNDWKGVFASRSADPALLQTLNQMFSDVEKSPSWQTDLRANGWTGDLVSGANFLELLTKQQAEVTTSLLKPTAKPSTVGSHRALIFPNYLKIVAVVVILAAILLLLALQRILARSRERQRLGELHEAKERYDKLSGELETATREQTGSIASKFEEWKLSPAESEVAWMILKGLSFKEIAQARGTSERTVRQQAQSIYSKSGLNNRSDLSGYFLEDMRFG